MNALSPKPEAQDGLLSAVGSPPPPAPRKSLFRRLRPLLIAIVLGAAALGGTWWWTGRPVPGEHGQRHLAGDIAVLSPRIEGDVAAILVADNQRVTAGQAADPAG